MGREELVEARKEVDAVISFVIDRMSIEWVREGGGTIGEEDGETGGSTVGGVEGGGSKGVGTGLVIVVGATAPEVVHLV